MDPTIEIIKVLEEKLVLLEEKFKEKQEKVELEKSLKLKGESALKEGEREELERGLNEDF